ncbi:hypothetical protein JFV29_14070 [Peribacillus sp. TH16]|uniref:hypothetical protein n=1 Tax=Peribacillus sp. TH16 TaxID=2798482 RepID=UPI001914AA48|nr:hypothetical protein [Peribacillus sp. TH16]MBK5482973.1 hypothetical protein [Peribacillus sp. TH16]MBK5482997.1 hypothetical protein [Peribacillus sp. TH16]
MNIVKEQQIVTLRDEAKLLCDQFIEYRDNYFVEANNRMLSQAIQELIDYLFDNKFILEDLDTYDDEERKLEATMGSISVTITKRKSVLQVKMSNGEEYDISIDSPISIYELPKFTNLGTTQDAMIQSLKNSIEQIKDKLNCLDKEEYRYIVHTTDANTIFGDIKHKSSPYRNFNEVLDNLFS